MSELLYQFPSLRQGTLVAAGMNSSQTTVPLATGVGTTFRTTATGKYIIAVWDGSYASALAAYQAGKLEFMLANSHDEVSDTIADVSRAQEGTSAINHNTGGITYYISLVGSESAFDWLVAGREGLTQGSVPTFTAPYDVNSYVSYPIARSLPSASPVTFSADVIYAQPHYLVKGIPVRGFKFRKNTAFSTQPKVGIWSYARDANLNIYPGALLLETTGASQTNICPVITAANLPFTPAYSGYYFIGLLLSIGGTIVPVNHLTWHDAPLGRQLHSSTVGGVNLGFSVAHSFAALPNPFTASATLVNSNISSGAMPYLEIIHQALS